MSAFIFAPRMLEASSRDLAALHQSADPFPHIAIDDFPPSVLLRAARRVKKAVRRYRVCASDQTR